MSTFNRKRQIQALEPKTPEQFYNELRNRVLDEVAAEIQKMTGFGKDTLDSLIVFIQGMKHDTRSIEDST
jgi:hypothetical protein